MLSILALNDSLHRTRGDSHVGEFLRHEVRRHCGDRKNDDDTGQERQGVVHGRSAPGPLNMLEKGGGGRGFIRIPDRGFATAALGASRALCA